MPGALETRLECRLNLNLRMTLAPWTMSFWFSAYSSQQPCSPRKQLYNFQLIISNEIHSKISNCRNRTMQPHHKLLFVIINGAVVDLASFSKKQEIENCQVISRNLYKYRIHKYQSYIIYRKLDMLLQQGLGCYV